jgi:hypothetical protein
MLYTDTTRKPSSHAVRLVKLDKVEKKLYFEKQTIGKETMAEPQVQHQTPRFIPYIYIYIYIYIHIYIYIYGSYCTRTTTESSGVPVIRKLSPPDATCSRSPHHAPVQVAAVADAAATQTA